MRIYATVRLSALLRTLCMAAVLTTATADGATHSILTYGGGKQYQTNFFDARLLGELRDDDKETFLIFSGRPDPQCLPHECDANTDIFVQAVSEPPDQWDGKSFRYPGSYYSQASRKLVATVRMFIGQCIDSRQGIVWFTKNFERPSPQVQDSRLATRVEFEYVYSGFSSLQEESPTDVQIAVAEAAVASHHCKEISAGPKVYASVTDYQGQDYLPVGSRLLESMSFGSTPYRRVGQWVKYVAFDKFSWPNCQPVMFFSTENFEPGGGRNESLIVLNSTAYDRFAQFARSRSCLSAPSPDGRIITGGVIIDYRDGRGSYCFLAPQAACNFVSSVSTLGLMNWTPEQLKSIHHLGQFSHCEDPQYFKNIPAFVTKPPPEPAECRRTTP